MLKKLRDLRVTHQRTINRVIFFILIVVWVVELLPIDILPFEVAVIYSFSVIATMLLILIDANAVERSVSVYDNHITAQEAVQKYISTHRIKNAKFILLSGGTTTRTIIEVLLNNNVNVSLLLQHPDTCALFGEKESVLATIRECSSKLHTYGDKFSIALYRETASLRLVQFDDKFVSVSWFTYHNRGKPVGLRVQGHPHPHITAIRPGEEYFILKQMSDNVFSSLQHRAEPLSQFLRLNPDYYSYT